MSEVHTGEKPKIASGETKPSNIFEMYDELQGMENNWNLVLAQLEAIGEDGGNPKYRLETKARALASYVNDAEQRISDRERILGDRDPLNKFGERSKNPIEEAHTEYARDKSQGVAMIIKAIDIGMRLGPKELAKAISTPGGLLDK